MIRPSSLVNLAHTPSSGIQRGGRVELSSDPCGKLVAYKSYNYVIKIFEFYCAIIAYHVELNPESNCPVAGLQLRLEVFSLFFLNLEFKIYTKVMPKYQSESWLQSPNSENWACN